MSSVSVIFELVINLTPSGTRTFFLQIFNGLVKLGQGYETSIILYFIYTLGG